MPDNIFNILIVDDEESMRELLDVMLSREGYHANAEFSSSLI